MSLSASLALDVRAFEAGLSRASGALDGFAQKTVKNTNRDLSRMLEEFTGQKVVAESARMAEAVERIGGASRLTEAEQRRVNATVTEAIAKYQALGQEAPAHLVRLQQATEGATQKTGLLSTGMQALIGLFSVRAIAMAASDVLEFTGNLTDLAAKTGIGTEELQRLKYVTDQSGVSLEQLASGVVMLGRNLVGGKDAAVTGVKALGLSVSDLIAMGPDRAFLAIGEAIAAVPNPMERAALATEIFGRAGADYLPAFTTDMAQLAAQADAAGVILSKDLVAAGDSAGDAITRMKASGMALLAQFLIPVLPAVEALANWAGSALPSSLEVSRGAIDALIRKGLELEVWLLNTAASIARTVSEVPVMGRVFGQSAADVAELTSRAQFARDALWAFTTEGAQPAAAAVTAAAPVTTQYGEALSTVATHATRATEAVGAMQGPSVEMLNLESRSIQETQKLTKALQAWANTNMATLAPSIRQVNAALSEQAPLVSTATLNWAGFAGSVQQNSAAAGASTSGLMDKFKGLFGGGGGEGGGSKMSQLLGQIGPQFAAAFMGPGSAGDKMKAFATQAAGTLMGMIPGVGPWLQAFSGPIVEGLSKLAAKGKAILESMFGGPSASEKEGRGAVADFEQGLWDTLDATQELEAGGENWKKTVIAIRDAYLKAGKTEEEALEAAERLWKSSKISAEESRRVIEEIKKAMEGIPGKKTIEIDVDYNDGTKPDGPSGSGGGAAPPPGNAPASSGVRVNPSGRRSSNVVVPVYIDGRQVAEATVPYIPGAISRRGV